MAIAELPAPVSVLDAARDAVSAACGQPLWQCTDEELAAEIGKALALRAQADAVLLVRLAEAESRNLSTRRGFRSLPAWLRAAHRLGPGGGQRPGPNRGGTTGSGLRHRGGAGRRGDLLRPGPGD